MASAKEPDAQFAIPSLHDRTSLACRLYLPRADQTRPQKAAIIAHPYAPLGGRYDDHVVLSLARELASTGYIVMTFNFRGARPSGGRTSWTGQPEIADYETAVLFLVYLWYGAYSMDKSTTLDLCLAGYSYGSQIVSKLPKFDAILERLDNAETKEEVETQWSAVAAKCLKLGRLETIPTSKMCELTINDSYLLVSPLLPPVSWFVSFSFGSTPEDDKATAKFHDRPVLAIWGSEDHFTSGAKLTKWAESHVSNNSRFLWSECEGVGHFWIEPEALKMLNTQVGHWIEGVIQRYK